MILINKSSVFKIQLVDGIFRIRVLIVILMMAST